MNQLTQVNISLKRDTSYQNLLFFAFTQPDGMLVTNIVDQIKHLEQLLLDGWVVDVQDYESTSLKFKCVECDSFLEFVGDYLVTCPNHKCPMYHIEFDA